MEKITLHKDLTPVQILFCDSDAWYKLYRAGRQGGKTEVLVWDWGRWAFQNKNTVNWYVAQDLANLKEKVIPQFEKTFDHRLIKDYSKSDKCYILYNNSRCYFKSGNSADGLRGRGVHNLAIDEAAFILSGASVYHDILRPQLITTNGRLIIGSSPPSKRAPKGAEWFRRLELSFKEEMKSGHNEYAIFHSTIDDNPFVPLNEKERIKRTTDSDTYQIEYMAEYCDKIGQVYWEFDPLISKVDIDNNTPVMARIRGMDFGIADNTACAWISLLPDNRVYVSDEYVANNLDVPTHAIAIKRKTTLPVQWTVLDSACWARDSYLTSVAKRFAAEGIACTPGTKDLDGSTSDLKRMFSNGKILVNPRCTNLLAAIDSWQHGQHEPDILAATRYGIDALIRTGKILPPIRTAKEDTRNWLQKREDLERSVSNLNQKLEARGRGVYGQSFKLLS